MNPVLLSTACLWPAPVPRAIETCPFPAVCVPAIMLELPTLCCAVLCSHCTELQNNLCAVLHLPRISQQVCTLVCSLAEKVHGATGGRLPLCDANGFQRSEAAHRCANNSTGSFPRAATPSRACVPGSGSCTFQHSQLLAPWPLFLPKNTDQLSGDSGRIAAGQLLSAHAPSQAGTHFLQGGPRRMFGTAALL